mgnify:CR=1 FL=1
MLLSTSIAIYLHQFSPEETVDILAEAGFTALDFGFFNPRYYAKELDGHFFTELRKKAEDKGGDCGCRGCCGLRSKIKPV